MDLAQRLHSLEARLHTRLATVPPFDRPHVRRRYLATRAAAERRVRRQLERVGVRRFSRPALHDLDRKLEPHLPASGGVFVEAGANDGYLQSNTYHLERFHGWTGVLVEPIPELFEICRRQRPRSRVFNCALVAPDAAGQPIPMFYGGLMSIVAGTRDSVERDAEHARTGSMDGWDAFYEVTVTGRTLTSVLEEAGVGSIDLLSLDVEGQEANVLEGLDLDRFAPRLVLVEAHDDARREAVETVLGSRYQGVAQLTIHDFLYRSVRARSSSLSASGPRSSATS